jgi:hypothetical protein
MMSDSVFLWSAAGLVVGVDAYVCGYRDGEWAFEKVP